MTKVVKILMFPLVVGSLLIFTACGQSEDHPRSNAHLGSTQHTNKIKIVAAENFYGETARAVGGEHVTVTSIITNPSVDPHEFEPTTQTAKKVADAQVVIYNGIGYDNWMAKLISSSNDGRKSIIRVGDDVMGKKVGENEHVWYIPETMPRLATTLANKLAKIDPKHARDYHHNAAAFRRSLQPFLNLVAQLKQQHSKNVEVTEPVFDYMLNDLNYKVINRKFSLAVEEGTDPRPRDMIQMQNDLKNHKVAFLVENIQVKSPTVSRLVRLAKENHVPVVKVTESLPKGKDYKTWMIDQLKQIEQIKKSK